MRLIFGTVSFSPNGVFTHKTNYDFSILRLYSVLRPLLWPTRLLAAAALGFSLSFLELLYLHELAVMFCVNLACLLIGEHLGQLKMSSREVADPSQTTMLWGYARELHEVRGEIAVRKAAAASAGDQS